MRGRVVDLARVRRALAMLDDAAARFPALRSFGARKRLEAVLDEPKEGGDRGHDGDEE